MQAVKGLGPEIYRIQLFCQKRIALGLNKNLYWFLDFDDGPLMSYTVYGTIFGSFPRLKVLSSEMDPAKIRLIR